jgi:hypothetical protein
MGVKFRGDFEQNSFKVFNKFIKKNKRKVLLWRIILFWEWLRIDSQFFTPCVHLRKTRVQTLITNQPKRNGEIGEQVLDNISDRMISLKE